MKLSELVETYGGHLHPEGDDAIDIGRLVSLIEPTRPESSDGLSFYFDARYRKHALQFAGAVLVASELLAKARCPRQWIHPHPRRLRRTLALVFSSFPERRFTNVDERAVIDDTAHLAEGVAVAPFAYVGPHAWVGEDSILGPHTTVEYGARIGRGCWLEAGSYLGPGCSLGEGVKLGPGAIVGSAGFGFEPEGCVLVPIPHVGGVRIEDGVTIGAGTCVDAGTLQPTVIGAETHIDNLVHVSHNVRIGKRCLILAQVGIAGSSVIEDDCVLAGQVGVAGHVTVKRGSQIAGKAGVIGNTREDSRMAGFPAFELKRWRRASLRFQELDDIAKRLAKLEAQLGEPTAE